MSDHAIKNELKRRCFTDFSNPERRPDWSILRVLFLVTSDFTATRYSLLIHSLLMPEDNNIVVTYDPLKEFLAHYAGAKSAKSEIVSYAGMTVEEKLKQRIIDG